MRAVAAPDAYARFDERAPGYSKVVLKPALVAWPDGRKAGGRRRAASG
jgi:hypothetical protein